MRAPLLASVSGGVVSLVVVIVVAAIALSGGGGDAEPSQTPSGETLPPGSSIAISATNNTFSTARIEVAAGARVTIEIANNDGAPHNFSVYTDEGALEEIYVGDTFTGPDKTQTEEFDAPSEPGDYFFRCDVHPATMTGTLAVN